MQAAGQSSAPEPRTAPRNVGAPRVEGETLGAGAAAGHRRVVLVAVSGMDRRAVVATAFARSVPAMTRAVVHVSVDPQVGESLAIAWKGSPLGGEPLYIVDDAGGVAATLAAVTCDLLAADADEVLVVAGQLLMPGIRRRLLHDHTADAIARVVNPIARASAVLLPVAARR